MHAVSLVWRSGDKLKGGSSPLLCLRHVPSVGLPLLCRSDYPWNSVKSPVPVCHLPIEVLEKQMFMLPSQLLCAFRGFELQSWGCITNAFTHWTISPAHRMFRRPLSILLIHTWRVRANSASPILARKMHQYRASPVHHTSTDPATYRLWMMKLWTAPETRQVFHIDEWQQIRGEETEKLLFQVTSGYLRPSFILACGRSGYSDASSSQ